MGLFDTFRKTATPKGQGVNTSAVKSSLPIPTRDDSRDCRDGVIASAQKAIEKRILFVAVGASWYQTVERDLAKSEPTWSCLLAEDVEQAVTALQNESFHALIMSAEIASELAMIPAIMEQSATLVRIVLCDGSNRAEMARWNASGANPLPQSTDGAGIAANVSRIARVNEWMVDAGMKKLLVQCRKLPATPKLFSEVSAELSSPNGSIDVVAKCIAKDPVMTAKLLQVVNSAFFALGREISDPSEAVMFLGAERTRALILLTGVFTQFEGVKCPGFSPEMVWNHSLQVGTLARTIARTETTNIKTVEAAFTAGLLHDMGKLILAANVPTMCNSIEQLHQNKKLSQREAEMQVLGTTHAELAACLLGTWALPLPVLEAVAWHHCPTRSDDKGFSLLTAVHGADVFAYEMGYGIGTAALPETFDHDYLLQIGLGDRRNEWRRACNLPAKQEEDAQHARASARRAAKMR